MLAGRQTRETARDSDRLAHIALGQGQVAQDIVGVAAGKYLAGSLANGGGGCGARHGQAILYSS